MDISIIILTNQGEKLLGTLLDVIYKQKTIYKFEVICVDSGSKDKTVNICQQYPVKLFKIKNHEFNHGLTRNLGINKASGDYVVFITQDSLPTDEFWLDNLVSSFAEDEKIAGVYCRQLPKSDADCITRRHLNNWLTAGKNKRINVIDNWQSYNNLLPMQKYMFCNFDDVCSCIKKTVWEKIPFSDTYFAEDLGWSKEVLEAGYKIMYQPKAAVIHSHNRSLLYEYKRTYFCHRRLYQLFKLQLVPSFNHALKFYFSTIIPDTKFIIRNEKSVIKGFKLSLKNFLLSFISIYAQYKGAKDEKNNLPFKKVKGI